MLLLQFAFCLEPIVQVASVYATAFEVQFICTLLDFIPTWGACELWLGPCRVGHLLFPIFHTCRHGFRFHGMFALLLNSS